MSTVFNVVNYLKAKFSSKKGQGMVEYGLILAALAVIVIACITVLRDPITTFFEGIGTYMSDQIPE